MNLVITAFILIANALEQLALECFGTHNKLPALCVHPDLNWYKPMLFKFSAPSLKTRVALMTFNDLQQMSQLNDFNVVND